MWFVLYMLAKELSWVFVIKLLAIMALGRWLFGHPVSKSLTPERFGDHLLSQSVVPPVTGNGKND
ncbi:MAG: hypothetical protein V4490_01315 [Pseudomonadota bacterium]